MGNYYAEQLHSQSLFQVYDTAIPRVKQYLEEEIRFVREKLTQTDRVLELGAGYGRIIRELAPCCGTILGLEVSAESVRLGKEYVQEHKNADFVEMDVHHLSLAQSFDVILCLQNGLSAMRATPETMQNILALLAPGGTAYFSTYSANFWDWRIQWFEEQAQKGLLGELDYDQTKDGVIVCRDGFRATTQTPEDYRSMGERSGPPHQVQEVDGSSLFLVIQKP